MAKNPGDVLPEYPYPGLNFFEYTKQDYNVFAGRDDDVLECNAKLHEVRVLVLHGRTGCGKSSFLRAGLKPRLDLTGLLAATSGKGDGEGLQILRTGARPLATVAKALFDFVSRIGVDIKPKTGRRIYAKVSDILEGQSEADFIADAGENPARLLRAISAMEAAVPGIEPVFVLDQAEEMWTLAKRIGAEDGQGDRISDKEARKQRDQLFKFILDLPSKTEFVRFIFSMRTEYKGQFDDELAALSLKVPQHVGGYYLGELTKRHLLSAVVAPTSQADVLDSGVSPYSKYKFEYDEHVAERIVDALLDEKSGTPRGGVLPVLQVACLRLYETTRKEAEADGSDTWLIKMTHFDQLGQIPKQIELFVQERLEQALRDNGHPWSEVLQEVESWYRLLNDQFVSVESDGRVTTRKVEPDNLSDRGKALNIRAFSTAKSEPGYNCAANILDRLRISNILRVESRADKIEWSLGHDSVGLAINRWSQIYSAQQLQVNPRTELASAVSAASVVELYDKDDPFEQFSLKTLSENVWDQMTIQYAVEKRFAARLGLIVSPESKFDVTTGAINSEDLMRALNELPSEDRAGYLIARPRHIFPNSDLRDEWLDVAITNGYQGYGLIGPKDIPDTTQVSLSRRDLIDTVAGGSRLDRPERNKETITRVYEQYCLTMRSIKEFIETEKSRIWLFDEIARDFLSLSLQLAGISPEDIDEFLQRHAPTVGAPESATGGRVGDALFEQLLQNPKHFMVGTAVGRAHSVRRGLQTYVEVQDLSDLIKMVVPARLDRPKDKRLRADLVKRQLKTQSHVTWQLGVSQRVIDDERIEPLLYRVAALGYYTSEYIRSNPDDFVRYLDSQLQEFSPPGTFRLDRESIRESIRACYVWPSFDQYAQQFLDRGSDMVYWQEDNQSSKARDIYFKMVSYRTRFLDEFRQYNAQYIRLSDDSSDKDAQTNLADRLKEAELVRDLAWNNYRVLNFYDAYRTMARARVILRSAQREMAHPTIRHIVRDDI